MSQQWMGDRSIPPQQRDLRTRALEVAMQDSVTKDCKRLAVNVHYLIEEQQGKPKHSKKDDEM